jgi:hypothetical protein
MEDNVYRNLHILLDKFPIGFPPTRSSVELRLLQYLFTPAEAEIAANLNSYSEPARTIHRRVKKSGLSLYDVEKHLDVMYQKGVIHGIVKKIGISGPRSRGRHLCASGVECHRRIHEIIAGLS